jgi:hypothetical protein
MTENQDIVRASLTDIIPLAAFPIPQRAASGLQDTDWLGLKRRNFVLLCGIQLALHA